jgi:2-(1,2-epoxy-1,2-dihydrophenyl)acetyl-CoA isomerase
MEFYQQKFEQLSLEVKHKHQLWIKLENESMSNAITLPMIDSLVRVLGHADFDSNIRVIVLTGSGKNFCAGGDVKAMMQKSGMFEGESNELRMRYMHGIQRIPKAIEDLSTPIIAMVNGAAIGAGCDLSMMCDLRIGSELSRFGETFTNIGLVPGDGGTFFLTRVLGFSKAMQMTLTSEIFTGEKAYQFGLLNFIYPHDQLENETFKLATTITFQAPVAQAMSKKALKFSYQHDLHSSLDLLASFQGITQRTHDHFEALTSKIEKRESNFKSK